MVIELKQYARVFSNPRTKQFSYVPFEGYTEAHPFGLVLLQWDTERQEGYLGFSQCDPSDTFSREKANMIASNRLQSKKFPLNPEAIANPSSIRYNIRMGFTPIVPTMQKVLERLSHRIKGKQNG